MSHPLSPFKRFVTTKSKSEISETGFLKPPLKGIHLQCHIGIFFPLPMTQSTLSLINSVASVNPLQNHELPILNSVSHKGLFKQYLALRTLVLKRSWLVKHCQLDLGKRAKLFFHMSHIPKPPSSMDLQI